MHIQNFSKIITMCYQDIEQKQNDDGQNGGQPKSGTIKMIGLPKSRAIKMIKGYERVGHNMAIMQIVT